MFAAVWRNRLSVMGGNVHIIEGDSMRGDFVEGRKGRRGLCFSFVRSMLESTNRSVRLINTFICVSWRRGKSFLTVRASEFSSAT